MPPLQGTIRIVKFHCAAVETLTLELRIPIVGLGARPGRASNILPRPGSGRVLLSSACELAATRDEFDLILPRRRILPLS